MRLPISNVFKGQSSGAAVSGRLSGGVVQVGEKLRVLPGDERAIVRCKLAFLLFLSKGAKRCLNSNRNRGLVCVVGCHWI
jgi:elongation factor 1 alpha-like protein